MSIQDELRNRIEEMKRNIQWIEEDEMADASAQRRMLALYEAELSAEVPEEEPRHNSLTARPKAGAAAKNQYGTFQVCYCTQKQTNYIKFLLDTKDLSTADSSKLDLVELRKQVAATQVNKKAASAIIDFLLGFPDLPKIDFGTPGGADFNRGAYEAAIDQQIATNVLGAPATDRQKEFVRTLLAEREGNEKIDSIRLALNTARTNNRLNAELVSNAITLLLEIPANSAKIPDGKYALPAEDGHFVFYQIDNPTEGKWAGYTFVSQLIGSVGSWNEQRLSRQVSDGVKARIAANVEEAARMFGIKAKACSYCSSPLSNIQSRAAGYGETCAHNHGFFYPTEAEAKEILAERGES